MSLENLLRAHSVSSLGLMKKMLNKTAPNIKAWGSPLSASCQLVIEMWKMILLSQLPRHFSAYLIVHSSSLYILSFQMNLYLCQYRYGVDLMKSSFAEKNLRVLMVELTRRKQAAFSCGQEDQWYLGVL